MARKKLLIWSTAGCVVATAAMALVRPGGVLLAMVLIIVSNTFYSYGESLTAAFLPELARPESMGKVSGWGWGFGYLGGMLTLVGCLAYVPHAQGQGQGASHFVPVTLLITAVVYALAASVTFALLRERAQGVSSDGAASSVGAGFTRLKQPLARRAATATSSGCWPAPWPTRAAWRWRSRWRRFMPSR